MAYIPSEMDRLKLFTRLMRLPTAQRNVLLTAIFVLGIAFVAVAILPFKTVMKLSARQLGCNVKQGSALPATMSSAVETAAKWVPWRCVCIHKGIAFQWLLRRAGVDAYLHYGVRTERHGKLSAHVWVDVDGETLMGAETKDGYALVATFPPGPQLRP